MADFSTRRANEAAFHGVLSGSVKLCRAGAKVAARLEGLGDGDAGTRQLPLRQAKQTDPDVAPLVAGGQRHGDACARIRDRNRRTIGADGERAYATFDAGDAEQNVEGDG